MGSELKGAQEMVFHRLDIQRLWEIKDISLVRDRAIIGYCHCHYRNVELSPSRFIIAIN